MTSEALRAAWTDGREIREANERRRRQRQAILVTLFTWLGQHLPRWKKVRTATMQVTAFGFLDFAAFQHSVWLGCVAVGVSLLILEYLGGDR
jgi:hypothetical protein